MSQFIADAQQDKLQANGWEKNAYGMSKLGVIMMTILQQKKFYEDPDQNIIVNSCCPGLVDTDMTGGRYPNTVSPDVGADTPAYLALLPADVSEPKGCFVKLRKVHPYPPNV